MKKWWMLLFLLLIPVVSAIEYECSDGAEMDVSIREVDIGERRSINGLGMTTVIADETGAISRIYAELIVGATKVTLSNETPTQEVEVAGDEYTVTLKNATDSRASVQVESSTEDLEEGTAGIVSGLQIMISESHGTDTSDMGADIILGKEYLILANDDVDKKIVTIDGTKYLVDLVSGSDNGATIGVGVCTSNEFVEVADEPECVVDSDCFPEGHTAENNTCGTMYNCIDGSCVTSSSVCNAVNDTENDTDSNGVIPCLAEGASCSLFEGGSCCGDLICEVDTDGDSIVGGTCVLPGEVIDDGEETQLIYYLVGGGVLLFIVILILFFWARGKGKPKDEDDEYKPVTSSGDPRGAVLKGQEY